MAKANKTKGKIKDKEILRNSIAHIISECESRTTCINCPFYIHVGPDDDECFFELAPGQPMSWAIRKPPMRAIVTSTEVESIKN